MHIVDTYPKMAQTDQIMIEFGLENSKLVLDFATFLHFSFFSTLEQIRSFFINLHCYNQNTLEFIVNDQNKLICKTKTYLDPLRFSIEIPIKNRLRFRNVESNTQQNSNNFFFEKASQTTINSFKPLISESPRFSLPCANLW